MTIPSPRGTRAEECRTPGTRAGGEFPRLARVLAVCAHPDDESFGLGAILAALTSAGTSSLLCFTHGEASTLGAGPADLRRIRAEELAAAAAVLGMTGTTLLDYPDGGLARIPAAALAAHVHQHVQLTRPDALLVFDEGGITGHPDHCKATAAALLAAGQAHLPVIAWAIPRHVAELLNTEFGTSFAGRPSAQIDVVITVDRAIQLKAIACHASQSADNPVLRRRLELLGDAEHLRYLRREPGATQSQLDARATKLSRTVTGPVLPWRPASLLASKPGRRGSAVARAWKPWTAGMAEEALSNDRAAVPHDHRAVPDPLGGADADDDRSGASEHAGCRRL